MMQGLSTENEDSDINNSDIIKKTLMALIIVATSKTSDDYAWSSVKTLIKELKSTYEFLKFVKIASMERINYKIDDIKVANNINNIDSLELGKALQDLIDLLKKRLGNRAGYFFLQEFKQTLGDRYHTIIKEIGVDLRLIDLQNQLKGIDSSEYKIKDNHSSNIAFIEKTQ
jgi:predicted metal-dependent hydrolase